MTDIAGDEVGNEYPEMGEMGTDGSVDNWEGVKSSGEEVACGMVGEKALTESEMCI